MQVGRVKHICCLSTAASFQFIILVPFSYYLLSFSLLIRDRPKTDFPFTAENETGVENGSSFSAVNENLLLFSAENETENETDENYSQPTVEVNL